MLQHQEFLNLSFLCMQVHTMFRFYPSFSSQHVSLCLVANSDIILDCKQPNHLFVSLPPLQLTHQRLFTSVHGTSENMMSSYYHSYTEASDKTSQPINTGLMTQNLFLQKKSHGYLFYIFFLFYFFFFLSFAVKDIKGRFKNTLTSGSDYYEISSTF